jgi:conjugative transfer signal peptidase TraF
MNARSQKTMLLSFALSVSFYVATDSLLKAARLHINFSDSVPIGLYREASERAGSYAAICLSTETVQDAIHAGLAIEHGTCPGGFEPILKPLFQATETSPIRYDQSGFSVDGRLLPNTAPKCRSRLGRPLAHPPFGIYRSGLWAISAFNSSSFDSRYFGPVHPDSIQFRAKPFLTF